MKYYVDEQGSYIGGFDGSVPDGGVEVSNPPNDGRQKFVDGQWQELPASVTYAENRANEYAPIEDLADALTKINSGDEVLKVEGEAQLAEYAAFNISVKDKYPKGE
jgi:hypothetical protein